VLSVRDEGFGIEAGDLSRIFDRFVQGKQELDRTQGGLGLGLTIAKNLAALHGGDVHAHSEGKGHGSEFIVTLPLARAHDQESVARAMDMIVPTES
jgi:signal transduction histidine kinase